MNHTTENKKNIFYITLLILTLIITLIGTVYALGILARSQDEGSSAVYTGTLTVEYLTGRYIHCTLMPMYAPESLDTKGTYITSFKVKSTGTLNAVVDIELEINHNEFPAGYIKYALYNSEKILLKSGGLNGENKTTLLSNVLVRTQETATYTIQIWLEETGEIQNDYMQKTLTGKLNVYATQEIE